jgi:hypothetical protein
MVWRVRFSTTRQHWAALRLYIGTATPVREIVKATGVPTHTLYLLLKREDIPRRGHSKRARQRQARQN